jgi:glycosyl transferase, family 25
MAKAPFALYVIAHPAFAERHEYILRHVAERSEQPPVVVGIVGKDVLSAQPDLPHNPALSAGELGCALSHLAAYRHMVEHDVGQAIILEDDAALPPGFDDLARAILAELRPGEVISFHSPTMEENVFSSHEARRFGKSLLVTPVCAGAVRTALSYAIDFAAARNILRGNYPIKYVADNFRDFYAHGLVNYLRILTPAAVAVAPFESTIGYHGEGTAMHRLAHVLNQTPGISALLRLRRRRLRMSRDRNHVIRPEPSPLMQGNPNYADR